MCPCYDDSNALETATADLERKAPQDIDNPPFDADAFRESCGSDDLIRELLVIFREDVPPLMKSLEAALDSGDTDQAHQAAHALKGLVGNYAAAPTHAHVTTLDQSARTGDLAGARSAWPAVLESIRDLTDSLATYETKLT